MKTISALEKSFPILELKVSEYSLGSAQSIAAIPFGEVPVNSSLSYSMKALLAKANHILVNQGVLDAFGHVSARDPDNHETFLLSRNLAPALVRSDDIMSFDFDGNALENHQERVYLERFLHGAIYRARPDVHAVVHSHSQSVVPFTVVKSAPLRPVCHMGGFLTSKTPLFEIRGHAGDGSDLLIRNSGLGIALAQCLADQAVVLMRGHGITVVGSTLQQAVFRAVYAEKNAAIQAQAMVLGEITYLTDAEAASADAANLGQVQRAWDYWTQQADLAGPGGEQGRLNASPR